VSVVSLLFLLKSIVLIHLCVVGWCCFIIIIVYHNRHHDHCVLFTGTKGQHAIHYWSLYDNKILRKFRGHADTIVDVAMSPAEDTFLTASKDRTVRLWNVQQAGCVGQMEIPGMDASGGDPHVVFDSTGMVFAVTAPMPGKQGNVSTTTVHPANIAIYTTMYETREHLLIKY
jgi:WD40 repeat protein